jgi:hypothetical protein
MEKVYKKATWDYNPSMPLRCCEYYTKIIRKMGKCQASITGIYEVLDAEAALFQGPRGTYISNEYHSVNRF